MADIIDDIINRTYQSTILNRDVMDEEVMPEVVGLGAPMSGRDGTTSQQDVEQEQEAPRPTNAVMGYLKRLAQEYGYNAKTPQAGVRVPAITPTLDTTKMYDVYNTPLYDFMRNNAGGVDEDISMWVRENRDLPSEVLDDYLSGIQDGYDYRERKPTRMVEAPEGQGELSNPEPLYKMAEEIDPGTIETSEIGLMARPDLPPSESRGGMFSMAEQDAMDIAIDNIGIDETMWAAYKEEVAKIESGGKKNPYQVAGGANKHYDGKYQLGKMAKADAAQLLGITLEHDKEARDAFRKNPALQEKAFAAYTAKNHSYLMNKSEKYRNLEKEQQIAVLGYAHNQGWSEAKKWLDGGTEGKDAFGTKGSKYYKAIAKNLGITPSLSFTEGRDTSPRPMLRPEEES